MKRILSILIATMLVMSLVACGSSSGGDVKKPSNVSTNNTSSEENQQSEQSEKQEVSTNNISSEENQQSEQSEKQEVTISEAVLVDEAGIKITAKSLSTDEIFGPEIKLLIENNSGKDLTFQCRNASVNGYMVETMMSADVVNGKKANDSLTFMESDFETCGIDTISDVEFSFHVFDMSDWETYLDTALVQIKTSAADTYEYKFDDSGDVAYEGNGLKVVIKGLAEDSSIFGPSIVVYIENNSDKNVTVQTRDVSINGFMVDAMFSCDVVAGKHAVDTITFMDTDLEENEITAIEDVELSFHVFEADGWDTIVDTDVVTITF